MPSYTESRAMSVHCRPRKAACDRRWAIGRGGRGKEDMSAIMLWGL
jgi:hypothetical protein